MGKAVITLEDTATGLDFKYELDSEMSQNSTAHVLSAKFFALVTKYCQEMAKKHGMAPDKVVTVYPDGLGPACRGKRIIVQGET